MEADKINKKEDFKKSMKIKFAKILGVGATLALLASLLVSVVPAAALSQPTVSVANPTISATTTYTMIFTTSKDVAEDAKIVIGFPSGTDLTEVDDAYTTGTATFASGSMAVVGVGTTWTTAMAGKWIIDDADHVYVIASVTDATHLTLSTTATADASDVAYTIASVLLSSNGGIGSTAFANVPATDITKSPYASGPNLTIIVPDVNAENKIGLGSLVAVYVADVKNPNTAGDYTLTLGTTTSADVTIEAAVTSGVYTIYVPGISPLPGIVSRYNSAGVLMEQSHVIQDLIDNASNGDTIKVGPGTYDEALTIDKSLTIQSTDGAALTIIKDTTYTADVGGPVLISFDKTALLAGVVLDGFTLQGNTVAPNDVLTITGYGATVKNCVFTKPGLETTTVAQTIVTVNPTHVPPDYTYGNTITDCSFDFTLGNVKDWGVWIESGNAEYTTVKNCTFLVDATTAGDDDVAIEAADDATLSGITVTGSSGWGIYVPCGTVTVSGSTLTSLTNALHIIGGTVTVSSSTIKGCGSSIAGLGDAIEISNATVKMYGNTIQDSAAVNYAMNVASGTVYAWFNNITGNAYNIKNVAGTVDARHNWWGATTGPATGSNSGTITTSPVAGASIASADAAFDEDVLDASTTVGVSVNALASNSPVVVYAIAVAKYSGNPQTSAPIIYGTGSVLGYYDVLFINQPAITAKPKVYGAVTSIGTGTPQTEVYNGVAIPCADTLQIKFYGAVTSYTKVYYGGALSGAWTSPSSTGFNVAGGYAFVTASTSSNPSLTDLTGTPFAVVEDKTTDAPTLITPTVGEYSISITPTYTWSKVLPAIRYEIALSEDPSFAIVNWSYNCDFNFYKDTEELKYDTTYYWRVRGVLAEPYLSGPTWITPATPWATGIFTTEAEPVAEEPQEITVPPSEVTVSVPPTKVTVESPGPFIPEYILWVIVGVGAVLIIALIVLIVRTRRAV
jgi:hypothetical protein